MSVFLERLSMLNMLNCAEQMQIQKYKTCIEDTQNKEVQRNRFITIWKQANRLVCFSPNLKETGS